jgi:hypothetical protein
MMNRLPRKVRPPTWEQFRAAVRKHDRDSILLISARLNASIARGEMPDTFMKHGITPWNIASVARTSLAWAGFQRPIPTAEQFLELCSMDANLSDEERPGAPVEEDPDALGKVLARLFFEQFPGQRSPLAGVARSILLFGTATEYPPDFIPEAMTPGWFERITGGISLDDYLGAVFLVSVGAQQHSGTFDVRWLDNSNFIDIGEVIDLGAVRRTFSEFLLTTPSDFKAENRVWQDPRPAGQKKFAFNPFQDKPFVELAPNQTVTPWVQAVLMKAMPPAVYFMGLRAYGEAFTRDLGHVYQHYVGRQLDQISAATAIPETKYGPRKDRRDSCDWFLDLPDLIVLIECKARQPIESLRTGSDTWLSSVEGSIGKAISQLNQSNKNLKSIAAEDPRIDASKPRVGLVVTLEPFYVNNNPWLQAQLPNADFPVGVISIGELEDLTRLGADAISEVLTTAPRTHSNNVMQVSFDLEESTPDNRLLVDTWDTVGFLKRVEGYEEELVESR